MEKPIEKLITATNAFDIESAVSLFARDAVVDDVSVGKKFIGALGVREYLEKFFIGYSTMTKLEFLEVADDLHAKAQVDFTGDFGHETGSLDVTINNDGLIVTIYASLD
jgi:ketosteroid isomerase-like protein